MGLLKRVWYWFTWVCCLPITLLGAVMFAFGVGVPFRVDGDGVTHWRASGWGVHHWIFSHHLAGAYAMGCNICWPTVVMPNPAAMAHEKRHVAQMRWWMTAAMLAFFVLYLGMAGYSLARCGNIWRCNEIEQDAIRHEHE